MATSTFEIENKAEERGRTSTALNHLTIEIASVRLDVRRLTWIAVPLVCVALVLSIVALVVALQLAYLLFVSRADATIASASMLASLPAGMAALPIHRFDRRRGLLTLCILAYLAPLALLADVAIRVFP